MTRGLAALLALAARLALAGPAAGAGPTPGERAFQRCLACHPVVAGEHGLPGPNLRSSAGGPAPCRHSPSRPRWSRPGRRAVIGYLARQRP